MERFEHFAGLIDGWFWETDDQHCFVYMSANVELATGVAPEWHYGKSRKDLRGDDIDDAVWSDHIDRLNAHTPFYDFRFKRLGPDNTTRWISSTGEPFYDPSGMFLGFRGIGRDITEEVALLQSTAQTQKSLIESERRYRQLYERNKIIVETLPDVLFILDEDGNYIEVITEQNNLLCAEKSVLETKNLFEVLPNQIAEVLLAGIRSSLITGNLFIVEYPLKVPAGDRFFEARITPLRESVDERKQVLFIGRDITERYIADKAKSEFTATVSHELRTPLTSIKGALGLVRSGAIGPLAEKQQSILDIAYKNSNRLVALINDILDIEKIEAGKLVLQVVPMDIVSLIKEAVEANAGYGVEHGVSFVRTGIHAPTFVNGDKVRLMQVLSNLMSNAAKFSPDGTDVELSVACEGDHVRVSVKDVGVGISEDFKEKIFEKFTQEDGSDTRAEGGTGLGLSISKTIVEQHRGTLEFTSEVGLGTTFFITLPILE